MDSKIKKKTRQEQKETTRNLILEISKKLFLEQGYEKTTMRMIAKKACVATGTAFTHFPDKRSILMEALFTDIQDTVIRAMESMPSNGNFIHILTHIAGQLFEHYAKTPELSKLMIKESLFSEGTGNDRIVTQFFSFGRLAQGLLENAQQRGELHPDSDCSLLAQSFMAHYFYSITFGLRFKTDVNAQNETFKKHLDALFFGHILTRK